MKYLSKFIVILFFIFVPMYSFSQFDEYDNSEKEEKKQRKPFMDKIFYGGEFGLQFGSYTSINLAPQVGYYFNDYFGAGVGVSYTYARDRFYNYQTYLYGGSAFIQAYPLKMLIVQGELLALNYENYSSQSFQFQRAWDLGMLIGGGYRMRFGKKSALNYMILWNFNNTENTPYTNPIFRISMTF